MSGRGRGVPWRNRTNRRRNQDPVGNLLTAAYRNDQLTAAAVLSDKFVPQHLKNENLKPVDERWILRMNEVADAGTDGKIDAAIADIAQHFIPAVPSTTESAQSYDPRHYLPAPHHILPPDLTFGLREYWPGATISWRPYFADLDETTSIKEYTDTFRSALRLEHEELMRMYEKYSLFNWSLKGHEGSQRPALGFRKAVIHIAGAADARPALQISDIVLLRPLSYLQGNYKVEIESHIESIIRGRPNKPDEIVISWKLTPQQIYALNDSTMMRKYAIRFVPNSTFLECSLTALNWVENLSTYHKEVLSTVLFPVTAPIVKKPLTPEPRTEFRGDSDIEKPLNELQLSFVRMVRARTLDPSFDMIRPPMILTGPAGTGKTNTLINAIADVLGIGKQHLVLNTSRVLVCCPSHAASDVLTRRLSGILRRSEIFRLYDSSRPSSTVPSNILPFTCQVSDTDVFTLPQPPAWTDYRVVVCTCLDAQILFRAQITNSVIRKKQLCFRNFIMSAMSGGHPLGLTIGELKVTEDPFFTHLFIDEAAQATEPEILCPISCVFDPQRGGRKVEIALCGDPRQLSPRVYSSKVVDTLGRSFMERLLRRPVTCMGGGEESLLGPVDQPSSHTSSLADLIRYYASVDGEEQLTIFLTENYRGHPSFLMMPSSLFYFDRLKSVKEPDSDTLTFWCNKLRHVESLSTRVMNDIDSTIDDATKPFAQIHRQTTWPIHFRGVCGVDSVAGTDSLVHFSGTDSWKNTAEVKAVVEIIAALISSGVAPRQIGAMTPFRGQVTEIRKALREKQYYDVNVGIIENYQAIEQDVIVLSLTRANAEFIDHDVKKRMGIFRLPKQANVAMTRAENLFIVVGNPNIMAVDPLWRQYLHFCYRNGLWYGDDLTQKLEEVDISYVSTIDLTDEQAMTSQVVVSTLEKIQRVHNHSYDFSRSLKE